MAKASRVLDNDGHVRHNYSIPERIQNCVCKVAVHQTEPSKSCVTNNQAFLAEVSNHLPGTADGESQKP